MVWTEGRTLRMRRVLLLHSGRTGAIGDDTSESCVLGRTLTGHRSCIVLTLLLLNKRGQRAVGDAALSGRGLVLAVTKAWM